MPGLHCKKFAGLEYWIYSNLRWWMYAKCKSGPIQFFLLQSDVVTLQSDGDSSNLGKKAVKGNNCHKLI